MIADAKIGRLGLANSVLYIIASHGRRFFNYDGRVSHFRLSKRGRRFYVVFFEAYNSKEVYCKRGGPWKGLVNGGTMRSLIESLHRFIVQGEAVPLSHFGPWPEWLCEGDLWGYGDEMQFVRDQVRKLLEPNP